MAESQKKGKDLRVGFSTGACATACAKGAALLYLKIDLPSDFSVKFPDGSSQLLKLKDQAKGNNSFSVSIIKDAGDDPDITDQAEITCSLQEISGNEISAKDYTVKLDNAELIIRGGDGVGLVTCGGLDVPKGKWAINPVPRQMIQENLLDIGLGKEHKCFLLEISIKNGEDLAVKTLNPLLGIEGGLSILGTSGFVVPYSNSAYIDTIKILVRNAAISGLKKLVLCTGSRTHKAAEKEFRSFQEETFIRMADFIAEAMQEAGKHNFEQVIISCMPGKLFKYAQGFANTHAHKNKLDPGKIAEELVKAGVPKDDIEALIELPSIREITENLSPEQNKKVLDGLGKQALKNVKKWLGNTDCAIYCFDYNGCLLGKWS